jgi:hypothetical protein
MIRRLKMLFLKLIKSAKKKKRAKAGIARNLKRKRKLNFI